MATTQTRSLPIRSKFAGEGDNLSRTSLSSREVNTTGATPKARPTLPVAGFVGSFGRGRSKVSKGVTVEDLNMTEYDFVLNEKVVDEVGPAPSPISITEPAPDISPKSTVRQTEYAPTPTPAPRAVSRSRNILRLITTKFRLPSSPSSPSQSRPAAPPALSNSYVSKENREAALRERGLLPPLPNLDLSAQEQKQDQRLSVIVPVNSDEDSDEVTAAKQIKREWEARNKGSDSSAADAPAKDEESPPLERLNNFKFGNGSPTSPTSPDLLQIPPLEPEFVPQPELHTLVEVDTPASSPTSPAGPQSSLPVPQTPTNDRSAPSPSPSSKSARSPRPPALDFSSSKARTHRRPSPSPSRPLPAAPVDLDADVYKASTIPLPPSPFIFPSSSQTPTTSTTPLPADAYSIPLPPSPLPGSLPTTPRSAKSRTTSIDTPKALETKSSSATATPLPSPPPPAPPTANTLLPPVRASSTPALRTLSESESLSTSSMTTPSLSADTSTIATTSSLDSPSHTKPGALKTKTQDLGIPMIVESPVEEGMFSPTALYANAETEDKAGETVPSEGTTDVEPSRPSMSSLHRPGRPRGATDPNPPQASRRKSMGLFRRGDATDSTPHKVLSVSTSLSNIRRSFVGSLSRPKSTLNIPGMSTFDASHLPPSPTVPTSFAEQASSKSSPSINTSTSSRFAPPRSINSARLQVNATAANAAPRTRQALSPTIHSRGSIVLETWGIEDEESRRLSELAFLG